ncbi:MAG: hypothetical protein IJJ33_18790 [Victivallales bacterium]|nr:hypothetical protein [Victivallales bacterium]
MKKVLCRLCAMAMTTVTALFAAPKLEVSRLVNGAYEPVSGEAGLEVALAKEPGGNLEVWKASLANRGKEPLLLRLRMSHEGLSAGGDFWDGFEFHPKVRDSLVPAGDRHVFPMTVYLADGRMSVLGFTPDTCASRFERALVMEKGGKATLRFDVFWALLPGEELATRFVSIETKGESYVEAVERYHLEFPEFFRPVKGFDERGFGTGGYLSSLETLRDYQLEECRRTGFDWEWYYNCYQRAGDFFPKERFWDEKLGYKRENSHGKCNIPGTVDDWLKYHQFRTTVGNKTSALFYYYMQQYCNAELLHREYEDSAWRDENGHPGYQVTGWADEFLSEYAWPGKHGSFGKVIREDLAKIWQSFPIAGFALDCAIGSSAYYGPLVTREFPRSFDDKGRLFVKEGLALAYNMDYTRSLPPHADGRRAGSMINAPYTYLPIFHCDGVMHEATPYERMDLPVPHRLMLGQKAWVIWRGFVMEPFLDWNRLSPDQVNEAMSGAVDYLILFTLRMGASPSKMFTRGYPDMRARRDLFTENARRGWRAAPFAWVEGVAGSENPWDLNAPVWVSRYGEAHNSRIVLSIPRREGRKGRLRIETSRFGAEGAVYAALDGTATVNHVAREATIVEFDLAPFRYVVLERVGTAKEGRQVAVYRPCPEKVKFLPGEDFIPELPLDNGKAPLAAIVGEPEEIAAVDWPVTALSTYDAFYRTRLLFYGERLWGLEKKMQNQFRFPIERTSDARTVFAVGKTARERLFPGVEETDAVVHRRDGQRDFVAFFPGTLTEAQLIVALLEKLDKWYPFHAGPMSDWPIKVKAWGRAFVAHQPTFADASIHPAHVARHALKADELAVGRAPDGNLYLRTRFSGDRDLVTQLILGPHNRQFEYGSSHTIDSGLGVTVNSLTMVRDRRYHAVDETAPMLTQYGYVGGNHGLLVALKLEMHAHGLAETDLGTEFISNGRKYYPVAINDSDHITVMSEKLNRGLVAFDRTSLKDELTRGDRSWKVGKIIHEQLYPSARIVRQRFLVDGKEIPQEGTFIRKGARFVVEEVYDVLDPASLFDAVVANPGRKVDRLSPEIARMYTLENHYEFAPCGSMVLHQKYTVHQDVSLRQISVVMSQALPLPTPRHFRRYLIPKTKAFTQDGSTYDFSRCQDFTQKLPHIDFMGDRLADPTNLPDSFVQLGGEKDSKTGQEKFTFGLALGYLTERGQREKSTSKAGWIWTSQKTYPVAADQKLKPMLKAGDVLDFTGYRVLFQPCELNGRLPAVYRVQDGDTAYLFCNFMEPGTYELPPAPEGRRWSVREASALAAFEGGKAIVKDAPGLLVLKADAAE